MLKCDFCCVKAPFCANRVHLAISYCLLKKVKKISKKTDVYINKNLTIKKLSVVCDLW